jgi:hypothetical protein
MEVLAIWKFKYSKLVFKSDAHPCMTTFDVPFSKFQYSSLIEYVTHVNIIWVGY